MARSFASGEGKDSQPEVHTDIRKGDLPCLSQLRTRLDIPERLLIACLTLRL